MPLCITCGNSLVCSHAAEHASANPVEKPCSLKKGAVWVHVMDDAGDSVDDIEIDVAGTKKPTKDGFARFDDLDAKKYTATLALSGDPAKVYEPPTSDTRDVWLSQGEVAYLAFTLPRKPKLTVKVVKKKDDGKKLLDATVTVTGPGDPGDETTVNGVADYKARSPGAYVVKVALDAEDAKAFFTPDQTDVTLVAGVDQEVVVEAEAINVVTPKIEMEYAVVLLDRKLSDHQDGGETKIFADATRIEVSFTETNPDYTHDTGAKLECDPENVDVYVDEDCKNKLVGDLTKDDLEKGKVKKLYLKGAKAGAFKVRLRLADPADKKKAKLDKNPAEVDMGVVEIELEVHQQDATKLGKVQIDPDTDPASDYHTNLESEVLPAQKEMSDADKVKVGRLLHAQDAGHHGRARLLFKQLEKAEWPKGTGDYKVVVRLTSDSGAIAIHKKDVGDDLVDPVEIKVSDLWDAEQELWAEGKTATTALRHVRLDVGIDRDPGGLAKTPKRNADWARFTVVKIKEVAVDYTPVVGEAVAWDDAEGKFYINFKDDPDGRKVTLSATLSEKIEDVTIHFMLAPDKDNLKTANWNIDFPASGVWKDVPADLKHLDRKDRKDLLHLSAKTDDQGKAKKEVVLSRFGGDKFHPAAYVDEDAHLAKYVHGHGELEKRKPVTAAKPIAVWRKVYYQITRPQPMASPANNGFESIQQPVFVDSVVTEEKEMDVGDFTNDPTRPEWHLVNGGGDDMKLAIGTHNVDEATALFTPAGTDTKPKFHAILCDAQFDAKNIQTKLSQVVFTHGSPGPTDVEMEVTGQDNSKVTITTPPLQGGALIVTGTWRAQEKVVGVWTDRHTGTLDAGNVTLRKLRGSKREVRVARPVTCDGGGGGCMCGGGATNLDLVAGSTRVVLNLQLRAALGPYNGWAPRGTVANVVKGGRDDFQIHNTMAHELGHLFGQVRTTPIVGLPDHPEYYQKRGGIGSHCANGATWNPGGPALDPTKPGELDAQGKGGGTWRTGTCVLFGSTTSPIMVRAWCEHCAFDWIFSDLSKFR